MELQFLVGEEMRTYRSKKNMLSPQPNREQLCKVLLNPSPSSICLQINIFVSWFQYFQPAKHCFNFSVGSECYEQFLANASFVFAFPFFPIINFSIFLISDICLLPSRGQMLYYVIDLIFCRNLTLSLSTFECVHLVLALLRDVALPINYIQDYKVNEILLIRNHQRWFIKQ